MGFRKSYIESLTADYRIHEVQIQTMMKKTNILRLRMITNLVQHN